MRLHPPLPPSPPLPSPALACCMHCVHMCAFPCVCVSVCVCPLLPQHLTSSRSRAANYSSASPLVCICLSPLSLPSICCMPWEPLNPVACALADLPHHSATPSCIYDAGLTKMTTPAVNWAPHLRQMQL